MALTTGISGSTPDAVAKTGISCSSATPAPTLVGISTSSSTGAKS